MTKPQSEVNGPVAQIAIERNTDSAAELAPTLLSCRELGLAEVVGSNPTGPAPSRDFVRKNISYSWSKVSVPDSTTGTIGLARRLCPGSK